MSNPATPSDVHDRWLSDTPLPDDGKVQAKLDDAWTLLLTRDSTIDARQTAGTLDANLVRFVLCSMVLRVLLNPEGKRQEAIDDYSWTRDSALSAGEMYVSDAELLLLAPKYTGTTRGSVRLVAYGEV